MLVPTREAARPDCAGIVLQARCAQCVDIAINEPHDLTLSKKRLLQRTICHLIISTVNLFIFYIVAGKRQVSGFFTFLPKDSASI